MAALTLAGERYAIAPFRLRELRLAAPFIDRLGARAGRPVTVAGAADAMAEMLAVLAVGIDGADAEALIARASLADADAIREAFQAVMAEAGLRPAVGEATTGEAGDAGEPTDVGEAGGAPAP